MAGSGVVEGIALQALPAGASLVSTPFQLASETSSTGSQNAAIVSLYTVWGWSVGLNSLKGTTALVSRQEPLRPVVDSF